MNLNNYSVLKGNLARDPEIKVNEKDGSRRVLVTVAVNRNYKDKTGNYPVDYISCEGYFSAKVKGNGIFDRVVKGSRVEILGELCSAMWTDEAGTKHYKQLLFMNQASYGESKAVTDSRIAKENGTSNVLEGNFTELTEMSPEQIEAAYEAELPTMDVGIPTVQA